MKDTYDLKYIDQGSYGKVYELSPRRVVKVFHTRFDKEKKKLLLDDEIEGGKEKGSLPVLRTINIIHEGKETKGLVKRKMIRHATTKEISNQGITGFDICTWNCMADSKGKVFRVDTMSKETFKKM